MCRVEVSDNENAMLGSGFHDGRHGLLLDRGRGRRPRVRSRPTATIRADSRADGAPGRALSQEIQGPRLPFDGRRVDFAVNTPQGVRLPGPRRGEDR